MGWPKGRPKRIDLTGQVFSRLTVLAPAPDRTTGRAYWLCRCECGQEKPVSSSDLRTGHALSCGCWNSEVRRRHPVTHGFAGTPTYICWTNMRSRCSNPKRREFHNYGGRGIVVCERWQKFENFLADMGEMPPGMTLDRIDVNGHYEPSNCRWTSGEVQGNNRRNNVYVDLHGERMTLSQAARRLDAPVDHVRWVYQKHGDAWLSYVRAAAAIGMATP